MKLTNLRKVGRFRNKDTGKEVNIHKGRVVGRSCDVYYYLYRNSRIYVAIAELYSEWEKTNENY